MVHPEAEQIAFHILETFAEDYDEELQESDPRSEKDLRALFWDVKDVLNIDLRYWSQAINYLLDQGFITRYRGRIALTKAGYTRITGTISNLYEGKGFSNN